MEYKHKGVSHSLEILIGLIVCIFILMIAFKLLGVYSAYKYEQQAQITAQRLQTAMNSVCVTGQSMEVNIDFPQQLTSGGAAPDPISVVWGKLTGGKDISVTNALRYTTALQAFGDPWFVIYYEDFPQGEDSGWMGWSEIAAMRISSAYFKALDTTICVTVGAVPLLGDLKRAGSAITKFGKKGVDDVAEGISKASKSNKVIKQTDEALEIAETPAKYSIGERMWMNNIGQKIISGGKKVKGGVGKIFSRLADAGPTTTKTHLIAFRKTESSLDEGIEGLSELMHIYRKEWGEVGILHSKAFLSKLDNLKYGDDVTELSYKQGLQSLKSSDELKKIYEYSYYKLFDTYWYFIKRRTGFTERQIDYIYDLIKRIRDGKKITNTDVNLVKKLLGDGKGGIKVGCDDFIDVVESTYKLQKSVDNLDDIARSGHLFSSSKYPISYSRHILDAADAGTVARLPKLAAYTRFHHTGLRQLGKVVYREGRWIITAEGGAFIFNNVVSALDQAEFKFSPCSDHSLCLKSALNPSITIYPLDECKEANIDYIELNKHPIGGDSGDWVTTKFDNLGNWITGDKPQSKFYTASPCGGKVKIEKTTCECNLEMLPYLDYSSIDLYIVNCTVKTSSTNTLNCDLYINRTYIGEDGEREHLNNFDIVADVVYIADSGRYDVSFDLKSMDNWKNYFGEYYEDLDKEYDIIVSKEELPENPLDLTCEDGLVEYINGEKIECTPIPLPSVAFEYSTCDGSSNIWLECMEWKKVKETNLVKEGLEEDAEVPAIEWCCIEWNLTNTTGSNNEEIIKVGGCSEYTYSDDTIKTNLESAINKKDGGGKNIWGLEKPSDYFELVKNDTVATIKSSSSITIPKDINPNDYDINRLYKYNLPTEKETDCLKVTYIDDDTTKGFCYTSPMGWVNVKSVGWIALATTVDVGVELVIDFFTAGAGAAAGSFGSCMLGNFIMWHGESAVSEDREKAYWPNNVFFGNYYTD